jgi:hypothetical protein
VSSAWLEEFYPLSKDNLETMAAFIAVIIASTFLGKIYFLFLMNGFDIFFMAGQKKLYIYTRSHYLTERMSANCNTVGETHDLLDMLDRAIESMDSVTWVTIDSVYLVRN